MKSIILLAMALAFLSGCTTISNMTVEDWQQGSLIVETQRLGR